MGPRTPRHDIVEELRALDLDARRIRVADALDADARSLHGHAPGDLAELLGVPNPARPGASWSVTTPPPIERLEEHPFDGRVFETLWPFVGEDWPGDRRAKLEREFKRCDDERRQDFGFLEADERRALTRELVRVRSAELRRAGLGPIVELADGRELAFDCGLDEDGRAVDLTGPKLMRRSR